MSDVQIQKCKYLLPCGMCDKTNKPCSENEPIIAYECEHVWSFEKRVEYEGHIVETYKCLKCGKFKCKYLIIL